MNPRCNKDGRCERAVTVHWEGLLLRPTANNDQSWEGKGHGIELPWRQNPFHYTAEAERHSRSYRLVELRKEGNGVQE